MKKVFIFLFLNFYAGLSIHASDKIISDSLKIPYEKLKFVILCFKLSPPYDAEITALNKLANEYKNYVSPVVIKDDELNKYKELFTKNQFRSLQEYILNKNEHQKNATSFPVILTLNKDGIVQNAWSGDRTDDGLKRDEFYDKIKAGLEEIAKQR